MIKGNGAYSVNGVYYGTEKGTQVINSTEPLLLPQENSSTNRQLHNNSHQSSCSSTDNNKLKGKQLGKDCNILSVVRKLLSEPKNWFKLENKSSYQFLGILPFASSHQLWYTENVFNLQQSCDDPNFIWKDIQLLKGLLNKDRLINVKISRENKDLFFDLHFV